MTRRAHRAARVHDLACAALAVVPHHLELEPAGRLVVADYLDEVALLLVADVDPVLEERRAGARRFDIDRGHDARELEERRRGGGPLERAAERDQHLLRAGVLAAGARLEVFHQPLERKRHVVDGPALDLARHREVEERAADGRRVAPGARGINHPRRRQPGLRRGRGRRGGRERARDHDRRAPHHRLRRPSHHLAAATARACVPGQQSSATLRSRANAGPSRSAIARL